jgi:hypothetical protein
MGNSLEIYMVEFKVPTDSIEITKDFKCVYFRGGLRNWLQEKLNFSVENSFEEIIQETIVIYKVSNQPQMNSPRRKELKGTVDGSGSMKTKIRCLICKKDNHSDD